jgi:hypothetical protein
MVAARHLEMAPVIGEGARFHIFDPGAVHTQGTSFSLLQAVEQA